MIIRIEKSGGSFRGAGKYYLHDKQKDGDVVPLRDQTDQRVWFTHTRNTLNSDPERALDEMWRTAEDQAYLKLQAGVRRGGRVCEDPVKTISLAWHKDDRPDAQHMVDSADAFLKHMGWDNHQTVYVGHSDTEHRHIHIILNRIDHETGRTLDDYKERKRAQSWALAYEKEHDNVRCEERELRAAQRERRSPELNDTNTLASASQDVGTPRPTRTPANDHLPHNVVMISRPLEQEFDADERARAVLDEKDRATLKAHQRAEREQFFKDGGKLFKAARHAAYDDVRKEFKAEWREFYKEARQAGLGATGAKDKAVDEAIYAAYSGDWFKARTQFDGRDDQMKAVAHQFAERKADIEARQKEAIAERQQDVCDGLRLVRDVQYQELLQRQRNERASLAAGTELDALGISNTDTQKTSAVANQNIGAVAEPNAAQPREEQTKSESVRAEPSVRDTAPEQPAPDGKAGQAGLPAHADAAPAPSPLEAGQQALQEDLLAAMDKTVPDQAGGAIDTSALIPAPSFTPVTDAAALAIGSVASYLADQLGELLAPTPPELREAQSKAEAKREAEKPVPEDKSNAFARQIDAALRIIEEEKTQQDGHAYWEERDRGKGYERDQ